MEYGMETFEIGWQKSALIALLAHHRLHGVEHSVDKELVRQMKLQLNWDEKMSRWNGSMSAV
jgi:hypothetical protein